MNRLYEIEFLDQHGRLRRRPVTQLARNATHAAARAINQHGLNSAVRSIRVQALCQPGTTRIYHWSI